MHACGHTNTHAHTQTPPPHTHKHTRTEVAGYARFVSFMDSLGGDLTRASGSPADLAAACSAQPDCVGFNTNGYLKKGIRVEECWYRVGNWSQNPNEGLYLRDGATPANPAAPAAAGYAFRANRDSYGADIRQVTGTADVAALAKACDAEPACVAFNTGGWLKSALKAENVSARARGTVRASERGHCCPKLEPPTCTRPLLFAPPLPHSLTHLLPTT